MNLEGKVQHDASCTANIWTSVSREGKSPLLLNYQRHDEGRDSNAQEKYVDKDNFSLLNTLWWLMVIDMCERHTRDYIDTEC